MKNYLNTLLKEKGINQDTTVTVQDYGFLISVRSIVEYMSNCHVDTQKEMKDHLVKIDFHNGDVMHFLKYVAKFLARG
jgi:hypothetical protein